MRSTRGAVERGIRRLALTALVMLALSGALVHSSNAAGASHAGQVNPKLLALPPSALPPGTTVAHSAVSVNADADGETTPSDTYRAQLYQIHQKSYDQLGRLTGYRMDFSYPLVGVSVGTEYLASVFPSAASAQAAMQDAIGPLSVIAIIGKPLDVSNSCTAGDACGAMVGPVPGTTNDAVLAIFTRGPILIETASQAPATGFDRLEPPLQATLYRVLTAADAEAKLALAAGPPTATPTVKPTATRVPPTAKPRPASKKKTCAKGKHASHCQCKKGYKLVHGTCKKKR